MDSHRNGITKKCVCVCLWPMFLFLWLWSHFVRISSPDLLKVKAAGEFIFFYLVFRSFVAGIRKPFWHFMRMFAAFIPFSLRWNWKFFFSARIVRNSQSVSDLTDNKSRESNALQTKYINKFCLYSAIFFSRSHPMNGI